MTPATPTGRQSVIQWPSASVVLSRVWVCGIFATTSEKLAEVTGFLWCTITVLEKFDIKSELNGADLNYKVAERT